MHTTLPSFISSVIQLDCLHLLALLRNVQAHATHALAPFTSQPHAISPYNPFISSKAEVILCGIKQLNGNLSVCWHAVTAQWCGKAITTQFKNGLLKVIKGMLVNAERERYLYNNGELQHTTEPHAPRLLHVKLFNSCLANTRKTLFWWNILNPNLCAINLLTLFLLFTLTDTVKAFVLSAQPIDR